MGLFDSDPPSQTVASSGVITANIDGGSRGNPGPSGYGVLFRDGNGKVIAELSEFLGRKTNNHAEYCALLAALRYAREHGIRKLKVISDSELLVKQMKGQYRVNSAELKPLHQEAQEQSKALEFFRVEHVLREGNREADRLANLAMDRGAQKVSNSGASAASKQEIAGIVRDGKVEFLDGKLPEGVRVKVRIEDRRS